MITNLKRYLPLVCLMLTANTHAITCPPVTQIKAAIFTSAFSVEEGTDIWELISTPFTHNGITWDVVYGLDVPGAANEQDAVTRGQELFKSAPILINNPPADKIPGYIFCDYTTTNIPYWISAISPPGR